MLPICYICLRGNIKLHSVEDDDLVNLYDVLCNLENNDPSESYQFCSECVCKLKKCSDFKKQCNIAQTTLKMWKYTLNSENVSINELHKQIPSSNLALSDSKNIKVYFYESSELGTTNQIQISSFHPHIITYNIPEQTTIFIKRETPIEDKNFDIENISLKLQVFTEDFSETADSNNIDGEIKKEFDSKDLSLNFQLGSSGDKNNQLNDRSKDSDVNLQSSDVLRSNGDEICSSDDETGLSGDEKLHDPLSSDFDSDSDESLNKLLSTIKNPKIKKEKKVNINVNERMSVLKLLKTGLRQKFKKSGDLKDEKGNLIDIDNMINGLDKMPLHYLRKCKNIINGLKTLNSSMIKELREVQSQFLNYASVFDIEYLGNTEQVHAEFAKRNQYPDYVNSQHRCEQCIRGFPSLNTLNFHCRAQHNPSLPMSCVLCKMRFKNKKNLSRHWTQLHSTVYKCKKCPYIVTHRDGMEMHYRKHEGLKFTCQHCNTSFNRRNQWYFHMNKYHKVKKNLVHCEICAYYTHSKAGLTLHNNRMHYGEKLVKSEDNKKCTECDVTFINGDVYKKHVDETHRDTTVKVKKPRGNKKACALCPAKGYGIIWMKEHFNKEHPNVNMEALYKNIRRFLCDLCGKGYQFKSALQTHMHSHSTTRPHKCSHAGCERTFVTSKSLMLHMERHLPPRHVCLQCGHKFRSRPNLINHQLTHKKDRCHKCEHCGKGFITTTLRNEHVRGVHLNIRRKRKRAADSIHCET